MLDNDNAQILRTRGRKNVWSVKTPAEVRPKALLIAGKTLFVAVLPRDEDRTRGELWAMSADDGRIIAKTPLPAAPAHEGLAAVAGSIFLATQDGRIVCLGR